MKRASIFILVAGSVVIGGCARMGRLARVNPVTVVDQKQTSAAKCPLVSGIAGGQTFAIDLDCYKFPGQTDAKPNAKGAVENDKAADKTSDNVADKAKPIGATAYVQANNDVTGIVRNRLEAVLLRQADAICEVEKGQIYANEAATGVFSDFAASALSTTSTIVGGQQAKSILSGLAGLATATKSNITANVYKNQIVPAITNVMDSDRSDILTKMTARHGETIDSYSVDEMIRMANSYHQACSFQNGVQQLLKASINKAGSDAIIKTINLRFAISNLTNDLQSQMSLITTAKGDLKTDPQVKAMTEKLAKLRLELANIAEATQSTTVSGEAHDAQGKSDSPKTKVDGAADPAAKSGNN